MTWTELVTTALVGTERSAFIPPETTPIPIEEHDPPAALLRTAAIMTVQRRAGFKPLTDIPNPVEPAPSDRLPVCSPAAAHILNLILSGQRDKALLPEWLTLARQAQLRVPPSYLAPLLSRGVRDSSLRPLIVPVLGQRGHWLASLRTDWSYGACHLTPEVWQSASLPARVQYVLMLRETDPGLARTLLEETWEKDRVDSRAQLLACLAVNLTMDDEPFLEAALDDRGKTVRQEAIALLVHLSGSRLVERMIQRLSSCLEWTGDTLIVTLPDDVTDDMERDGIIRKPPTRTGERGWWLQQMISTIPPSCWCKQWDMSPEIIIEKTRGHKWQSTLDEGWRTAAIAYQDQAWAAALYQQSPDSDDLLTILPPEQVESLILLQLTDHPVNNDAIKLLMMHKHPWSVTYSRTFIHLIVTMWNENQQATFHHTVRTLYNEAGLYISPDVLQEVNDALYEVEPVYRSDLRTLIQTRKRMREELNHE